MQGTHVLKFVGEDGRSVELEPHDGKRFSVKPLDFVQLVRAAESASPSFPVVITNGNASTAVTGLESDGPLTVEATLANNGPVIAYGLVDGGWIPMPWAHKRVAWVDRNVVIALEAFKSEVEAVHKPGNPSWLTRWLGLDTETVSPILFVLEGGQGRPPTDFAMRVEINRATKALQRLLPEAKVQPIDPSQRRALHYMVLERAESRARASRLLLRAAPLVWTHRKAESRLMLESQVLTIAREERVPLSSLPVLALISCVYDANPKLSSHRAATPGRAVLKPKANYSAADAYNALTDLFFIELMVNAHAFFSDVEPVLYTRDVGIAAMWTVMQPHERSVMSTGGGKGRATATFGLNKGLFPALGDDEIVALKARLTV